MNQPFIIKLPKVENKNLEFKNDKILFSPTINYPIITLGFHHYIKHTRKNFQKIIKNVKSDTTFYYVVNPFEPDIPNYEDDIKNQTNLYFKSKNITNDFLKIWEILFIFNLISKNTKNGLINVPIDLFLEKMNLKSFNTFKNEKDIKKDNSCDIIIYNSEVKPEDDSFYENEFYCELISNVINILKYQSEGGNSIIKFYDSFTFVTLKIISVISSFFDEVLVYKPFISRNSDSDKFLILKNFKAGKQIDSMIKILEKIFKEIKSNSKQFVTDIFPDMILSKEFIDVFKFLNIRLANNHQIMMNEIIKYIQENNYYGDKYHLFRDNQIKSSKWWITNFYPPSVNIYEKNKEELEKLYKTTQEKLNLECLKFGETLL